jgi:hypothetical protein
VKTLKAEKPATVRGEPASEFDQRDGRVGSTHTSSLSPPQPICIGSQPCGALANGAARRHDRKSTVCRNGGRQERERSMTPRASRKADRNVLLDLAKALSISQGKLKQDACGDWNIFARRGHISTDLSCFYAYLQLGSRRRWEFAKRTLSFIPVTQDGDNEGIFKICEMPTVEQATAIRKVFGMRKVTTLTEQQREIISRRLNLPPRNRAVSDDFIDAPGVPATNPTPKPRNTEKRADTSLPAPPRALTRGGRK